MAMGRSRIAAWLRSKLEANWSKANGKCPVCGAPVRLYPSATSGPGVGVMRIERTPEEVISACQAANGTSHSRGEMVAAQDRQRSGGPTA
jgi:hypothetical protein